MKFKNFFLKMLFCVFALNMSDAQTTITSASSGSLNSTATWVGSVVPASTENVVLAAGQGVALNVTNAGCNNLSTNGNQIAVQIMQLMK